ncbi:MAG: thymidine phosphorylase [Chloroflexi bacterium]|nr:thymidine phosphorylase [Chloroflexota bacterium]
MRSFREFIEAKRRGERHERAELEQLVQRFTVGELPDYQVAAWLMAVCFQGMTPAETADLTELMASSGDRLDLSSIGPVVGDKHSTGGVGDKTSLVAVPLAAACGLPMAKMSGRGLGFSGGTLDKLESIDGFRVQLAPDEFVDQVRRIGIAIVGQSPRLAPADGKLDALRDVPGTVESIPLLASSIMSKKLAAGASVIVLDVKTGRGAFLNDLADSLRLADLMVAIGRRAGRTVVALVTNMDQPLGRAVGNALEIAEVVASLRGEGPADLATLAETIAAELLFQAKLAPALATARALARQARQNGSGLAKLREMVVAQGGDPRQIDAPERLPRAPLHRRVIASETGCVGRLDARLVADAALALGAGRMAKGDRIDPSAGVVLEVKIGDTVSTGQPLAMLRGRSVEQLDQAARLVGSAFSLQADRPIQPALVHRRLD